MSKIGRKKLFEHLTKTHIKMDQKQKDLLKKLAKDEGLSLSEYLRKRGLMSIREILYDMAQKKFTTPIEFLIANDIISKEELEKEIKDYENLNSQLKKQIEEYEQSKALLQDKTKPHIEILKDTIKELELLLKQKNGE